MNRNRIAIAGSLLFCVFMVAFPSVCVSGARNALSLWANTALPALLPFFICANFMVAVGVPQIFGRAMEPVIRGVFRVPGEAAFAFIMSITSGYPVGAKIIADLRGQGAMSRVQAERAVSFCSTSGPLFMLGAVGAGMFASPQVGWVIALSHYTGALINGIVYGRIFREPSVHSCHREGHIGNQSFGATAVRNEKGSAGWEKAAGAGAKAVSGTERYHKGSIEILTESIMEAIKTLLVICGYMVLFLILIEVLKMAQVGDNPIFHGLFEMTIGCSEVSYLTGITMTQACILCTAIISWGGLSVQAQSLSFLSKTDIRPGRYLMTKITHMLFAAMMAIPFSRLFINETVETWTRSGELWEKGQNNFLYHFLFSSSLLILVFVTFCALSMISSILNESRSEAGRNRKLQKINRKASKKKLKEEKRKTLETQRAIEKKEMEEQRAAEKEAKRIQRERDAQDRIRQKEQAEEQREKRRWEETAARELREKEKAAEKAAEKSRREKKR